MTALSFPELGDERLVVVAAPVGEADHLGEIAGWTDYCETDRLGPGLYGVGAAVGTVTYTVLPAGTHGCEWKAEAEGMVEEARRNLSRAPACR